MFEFEKISVEQIFVFSEIVNESSLSQKEFIEKTYLRNATHFDETVNFLQELGLIETKENQVVLKPRYKELLNELKESQLPKQIAQKFIVNCLLNERSSFSEYLNEFLYRFRLANGQYEFRPSFSERLKYSGLRNFLIDLEFLYFDSTQLKYVVTDEYFSAFAELRKSHEVSPDEFLKIRQRKEEIGRAAELQILEYEKERLWEFPDLVEKIEHTAVKDVTVGYDIKSFEDKLNENSEHVSRFIEVKAVSVSDYGFNWTRNEIEKARLYRENYYIYLLPVVGKNRFNLKGLRIIGDPYSNVYKDDSKWSRTCELLAFSLPEDSNT